LLSLNIRAIHHDSIASLAADIEAEFDLADEPISWATVTGYFRVVMTTDG